MKATETLTYDDRCRKIAYALRDLPWTTNKDKYYAIFNALDSFRDGGSEISTVRAVLTALRRIKNGPDFDRVCTWASEWLAFHVCQPRIRDSSYVDGREPLSIRRERWQHAQRAQCDYAQGGQL